MTAFYNEHDPKAAAWLRELIKQGHIAPGIVDERSIEDIAPDELSGFAQCHWFAGIGVWSYALRRAGWPDDRPVWTGSCPCQPFSAAGQQKGVKDERHLWPAWQRLIKARKPQVVFGEQVSSAEVVGSELEASFVVAVREGQFARANKIAKRLVQSKSFHYWSRWIDLVCGEMEALGYAVRAEVLGAHSFGAPHIRQRLYFVADASCAAREWNAGNVSGAQATSDSARLVDGRVTVGHSNGGATDFVADAARSGQQGQGRCSGAQDERIAERGFAGGMGHAESLGRAGRSHDDDAGRRQLASGSAGEVGGMAEPSHFGHERAGTARGWRNGFADSGDTGERPGPVNGLWRASDWIACTDGKWRPVEPGTFPLAHGAPARVGRLRGYGNAIVAPVASAFVQSYLESVMA